MKRGQLAAAVQTVAPYVHDVWSGRDLLCAAGMKPEAVPQAYDQALAEVLERVVTSAAHLSAPDAVRAFLSHYTGWTLPKQASVAI